MKEARVGADFGCDVGVRCVRENDVMVSPVPRKSNLWRFGNPCPVAEDQRSGVSRKPSRLSLPFVGIRFNLILPVDYISRDITHNS
jgi:hypothetical protein